MAAPDGNDLRKPTVRGIKRPVPFGGWFASLPGTVRFRSEWTRKNSSPTSRCRTLPEIPSPRRTAREADIWNGFPLLRTVRDRSFTIP